MHRLISSILITIALSGCKGVAERSATIALLPDDLSTGAESAIAGDMANRLAEVSGNGKASSIYLQETSPRAGVALETALKPWGYSVVTAPETKKHPGEVIPVTYGMTAFEDVILVRLSTPSVTLTRAYEVANAGARPTTPLAVTQHP